MICVLYLIQQKRHEASYPESVPGCSSYAVRLRDISHNMRQCDTVKDFHGSDIERDLLKVHNYFCSFYSYISASNIEHDFKLFYLLLQGANNAKLMKFENYIWLLSAMNVLRRFFIVTLRADEPCMKNKLVGLMNLNNDFCRFTNALAYQLYTFVSNQLHDSCLCCEEDIGLCQLFLLSKNRSYDFENFV